MRAVFNVHYMGNRLFTNQKGFKSFVYSFLDVDTKRTFDVFVADGFVQQKKELEVLTPVIIECDIIPRKDGTGYGMYLLSVE